MRSEMRSVVALGCFFALTACPGPLPDVVTNPDAIPNTIRVGERLISAIFGRRSGGTPVNRTLSWSGTLSSTDARLSSDNSSYDEYVVSLTANEPVVIEMRSSAFDAFLLLHDANGNPLTGDDDGAGGTDARIEYTPPVSGTYRILANSFNAGETGAYQLTVRPTR